MTRQRGSSLGKRTGNVQHHTENRRETEAFGSELIFGPATQDAPPRLRIQVIAFDDRSVSRALWFVDEQLAAVTYLCICEPFQAAPGEPGMKLLWIPGPPELL